MNENEDITYAEKRNQDMALLINNLGRISDAGDLESLQADDDGVSIHLGYAISYRGEYETERAWIRFTWDEILVPSSPSLGLIARSRWDEARVAIAQEEARKEAQKEIKRQRELEISRETSERAKLAELLAKYGPPSSL